MFLVVLVEIPEKNGGRGGGGGGEEEAITLSL